MKKFITISIICIILSSGLNAQENVENNKKEVIKEKNILKKDNTARKDSVDKRNNTINDSAMPPHNKGVIWEESTLTDALKKAKANSNGVGPELVFLDCYTSWCTPCKMMAKEVFPQEVAGNFFNANFVNIKIDMEKGEGPKLGKQYGVRAYPTFLILDSEGNEINRLVGSSKQESFIEKVKNAMDPATSYKNLKTSYYADKSLDNAIKYMDAIRPLYMSKEISSFVEEIFTELSPEERYSDKMIPFVYDALDYPASNVLQLILNDKNNADKYVSKEKIDNKLYKAIKVWLSFYVAGMLERDENSEMLKMTEWLNRLSYKDEKGP
ncbi:MAG: thioredoxin family protein [Bacteroidales bacterium]|jgi:thiol-disulfide isomerase/thioredoxin